MRGGPCVRAVRCPRSTEAAQCPTCWSSCTISFIATSGGQLVGFACYDATGLGLFGPTGVHPDWRGRGIGRCLLLACLTEMKLHGYAYAVIGSVGPAEFYRKCCGAAEIPDSKPSIWYDMFRRAKKEG